MSRAFGLGFTTFLPIPEFLPGAQATDVKVVRGLARAPVGGVPGGSLMATSECIWLRWKGIGDYLVARDRVEIAVEPHVDDDMVRNLIVGPAVGALMHLRGYLVLHAACVARGDTAVAFLGDSQWGKSTVGAACYLYGFRFVADDTTAIAPGGSRVTPAYPRTKLWPESAEALGIDVAGLPTVHASIEKRSVRVDRGFTEKPATLARIYVLDEGDDPRVEPLDATEAFLELVRHSYAADLLEMTGTRASHFAQVTELVRAVPVRRLRTGAPLERVREIPALVAADLAAG